jgi:GNAT superfamily N-acetyltransferase
VIAALSPVETLRADHDVSSFDCGKPALDDWLKRFALQNQAAGAARTYIVHRSNRVVGYYALAAGSGEHENTPSRVSRGLARHPIPVVIVARLAVNRDEHGSGLGKALLKDALLRITGAADVIGVRAVVVHAKDEDARAFYDRFDFEPSPVDPMQLFLLMKDLKRAVSRD